MHYYGSCSEGSTVLAAADLHSIKLRNKIILQLIQRVIKYVSNQFAPDIIMINIAQHILDGRRKYTTLLNKTRTGYNELLMNW